MKNKKTELDVDFIGGQGPLYELTQEELLEISNYIRAHKARQLHKRLTSRKQGMISSRKQRQLTD